MRTKLKTVIFVLVALAVSPALAVEEYTALSVTEIANLTRVSGKTVGWEFKVNGTAPDDNIWVTRLGVYDYGDNGLSIAYPIGIWDSGGNLLTPDVTIPAGATSPLEGGYRYVDIAPIELEAQQTYTIGVLVQGADYLIQLATSFSADQNITIIAPSHPQYPEVREWSRYAYSSELVRPLDHANDHQGFNANFQFTTEPPVITVGIDIKPGSYPNSLNINGNGVIPVAILGSADFDVSQIDVTTLLLNGSALRVKGKNPGCHIEDVSGDFSGGPEGAPDGIPDLMCQFLDNPADWEEGQTEATVTGNLLDGTPIEGTDSVRIVKYTP